MNDMNLDRRQFLEMILASAASTGFTGCASLTEIGSAYPGWRPGELDLHFIYTGCGENMFYRLPDGTAILNDVGEFYRPRDLDRVPLLPSADRLGGDWVTRYIKRIYSEKTIDYAIFSHWHADHIGHAMFKGDGSQGNNPACAYRYRMTKDGRKVNGFLCVAEEFKFRRYLDHQYPSRGVYGTQDTSMELLAPWVAAQEKKGLKADAFKVGGLDQIAMLRDPDKYRDCFSIRNICANGRLWDGKDGERDFASEHVAKTGKQKINQNTLSMGFVMQYGKFRYWAGGDVHRNLITKEGKEVDFEGLVGQRVGPVSVCKMNHHGCSDAMSIDFVSSVRAQAYVSCMWCPRQAHPEALKRIYKAGSYDGMRPFIVPNLVTDIQHKKAGPETFELSASGASHVVVKVFPGGDRYRIYLLEAGDESMRVNAVLDRKC